MKLSKKVALEIPPPLAPRFELDLTFKCHAFDSNLMASRQNNIASFIEAAPPGEVSDLTALFLPCSYLL